MKIYIVTYSDYDGSDTVGYFTDHKNAELCCEYFNRKYPSAYEKDAWYIEGYDPDETDYASLIQELNIKDKEEKEKELELLKRLKTEEINRLKREIEDLDRQLTT